MTKIKFISVFILSLSILFCACQSPNEPETNVTEALQTIPTQETITDYSMDFEEGDDLTGLQTINYDKGYNTKFGRETNWTIENDNTGSAAKSGKRYICSYFNSDQSANDDWLILPLMKISETSELIFYAAPSYSDCSEEIFDVMIAQEVNLEQWPGESLLHVEFPPDTNSWDEYSIDLGAYSGQEMYIAFHCTSVYQYCLRIDAITVTNINMD